MQRYAHLLLLICYCDSAFAQDIIYKKDGTVLETKIIEAATKTITYKRWNNLAGPHFIINTSEVSRIKFETGKEEIFSADSLSKTKRHAAIHYTGNNIFSIAPVWITNTSLFGVGLSYESIVNKSGTIGIILPVMYAFDNIININKKYYPSGTKDGVATMLWLFPGIKVYPKGIHKKVYSAIGLSLGLGYGNQKYKTTYYDRSTSTNQNIIIDKNVSVAGVYLTFGFAFKLKPKLSLGTEVGVGIAYHLDDAPAYRNITHNPYYNTYRQFPLMQFNVKLGYVF